MTEKEAKNIAKKTAPDFPFCKTLEKGDTYVFLLSGRKTIPDKMVVAVTSDGKVGMSILSVNEAKNNANKV